MIQYLGNAKAAWGKLADDEILKSEGHAQKLVGRAQGYYAVSEDMAEKQMHEFLKSGHGEASTSVGVAGSISESDPRAALTAPPASQSRSKVMMTPSFTLALTSGLVLTLLAIGGESMAGRLPGSRNQGQASLPAETTPTQTPYLRVSDLTLSMPASSTPSCTTASPCLAQGQELQFSDMHVLIQ